jgi:hypothetical protein
MDHAISLFLFKSHCFLERKELETMGPKTKSWTPSPNVPSRSKATDVGAFVTQVLSANNLLGLPDAEIASMSNILKTCGTKREVYDWCNTLMLSEAVAAEVIKLRDEIGPPFESGAGPVTLKLGGTGGPTKGSGSPKTKAKRGTKMSAVSESDLVEGAKFECGCFASRHRFEGNCLNCGRIFCQQESVEACYNCGLDPGRCIAYEIRVQEGLVDQTMQQKNKAGYDAAVAKRDQLLKYAKERAKRTTVLDDQSGVGGVKSAWMSADERAQVDADEAKERRRQVAEMHRRTGAYTVHLDIVNQNVSVGANAKDVLGEEDRRRAADARQAEEAHCDEETSEEDENDDASPAAAARVAALPSILQRIWYCEDPAQVPTERGGSPAAAAPKERITYNVESRRVQNDYFAEDDVYYAQKIAEVSHFAARGAESLVFTADPRKVDETKEESPSSAAYAAPLLDKALEQHFRKVENVMPPVTAAMRRKDDGMCMSMHQPWASLLVAGIKVHEGRSWPTEHRGRLWIHAAAAKPTGIEDIERKYLKFCPPGTRTPSNYPTSCLLGYVYVVDCLDNSAFKAKVPPDERQEDSEYTFMCAEPKAMPFPLQMDGKHKIFKLDRKLWVAAKKQLGED